MIAGLRSGQKEKARQYWGRGGGRVFQRVLVSKAEADGVLGRQGAGRLCGVRPGRREREAAPDFWCAVCSVVTVVRRAPVCTGFPGKWEKPEGPFLSSGVSEGELRPGGSWRVGLERPAQWS